MSFTPWNIQDWLRRTPAIPVTRRQTYIELPAFSYADLEWKGASEVIAQFNFSASNKFTLVNLPTKPTEVNFGLCIKYRIGEEVFRFKLWDDDAFKLTGDFPLYTNEIIRANFVLEVWSYENETTAVNEEAVQMITSVRVLPTYVSELGVAAALAVGAEFTDFANESSGSAVLPTTNLVGHYDPTSVTLTGGRVSAWANLVSGWPSFVQGTAGNRPLQLPDGLVDAAFDSIQFNGLSTYLDASGLNVNGPFTIYLYCATLGNLYPRTFAEFGAGALVGILNYETDNTLRFSRGGAAHVDGAFQGEVAQEPGNCSIVKMIHESSDLSLQVENNELQTTQVSGALVNLTYFRLGRNNLGTGGYANFNLYEMIVYGTAEVSEADDLAVKSYLAQKYLDNPIVLPLTFNEGAAWLDNAN